MCVKIAFPDVSSIRGGLKVMCIGGHPAPPALSVLITPAECYTKRFSPRDYNFVSSVFIHFV